MSKALNLYRADKKQLKPVLVHCPNGGYPALDEHGEKILPNASHFYTEEEAWRGLHDQLQAWVSICSQKSAELERLLAQSNREAEEATRAWGAYIANRCANLLEGEPAQNGQYSGNGQDKGIGIETGSPVALADHQK